MKTSILIPSREEPFLAKTIEHLLARAKGEVEILVGLDGWGPQPNEIFNDSRVRTFEWSNPVGLRPMINALAYNATGDYLMKIDAHCAISEGFDLALQECDEDWLVVPTKYSLFADSWTPYKAPWNYFWLTFPWDRVLIHPGLHEKAFGPSMSKRNADKPIDDILTFQGSCWFLPKRYWKRIGPMESERYYIAQEAVELGLKSWLGGGRTVINKNAWYAHLHKGTGHKRGFARHKRLWEQACLDSAIYWMTNQWPERVHDMSWVVEKFWDILRAAPVGPWPDDWDNDAYRHVFVQ